LSSSNHLAARDIVSHITKTRSVLPLGIQADLLGISRTSVYYQPTPVDPQTLAIMNRIDELYTKRPFYGSRKIAHELGYNRKRIQRLMRQMGIEAIYQKPNLSRNAIQHPVYPYLLRNVITGYPNHVWGTDITYIRMRQGFVYLVAFLDWHSRYVLSWRLSTMLTTDFVLEAANDALIIGIPEIANSDQGMQFTSQEYLSLWDTDKTKISMDGRGRAMDNIFTERLWRSVKYEEVYLKDYASVLEAKESIGHYFDFYNFERKHQSLNYNTPAEIYLKGGKI
jgi:putative transposase